VWLQDKKVQGMIEPQLITKHVGHVTLWNGMIKDFGWWKLVNLLSTWPPIKMPRRRNWWPPKVGLIWAFPILFDGTRPKGCVLVFTQRNRTQIKGKNLHPSPHLQVMKNVNIVVLRVMTLTIVLVTLNFVPTNLPTNKDGKGKGGHRGHNSFFI